jgi:exosome complex component RRP42
MTGEIMSEIQRNYIYQLAEKGKRIDGRGIKDYRSIIIEKGVVDTAEGSARVKIGSTDVLVGVKMGVGEPFPDTPNRGVLTTNAELIPMASPNFESGPPREDAIELARVVDRGIRESETVDLDKLCITEEEKVWVIFIDIHVIDYGGNLIDASGMGALAALMSTMVPASKFEMGEDFKLPINHYPIPCTTIKVEKTLLVDPIVDEERIADARLTVSLDENGDIRAMQKGLSGAFTTEEVEETVKTSQTLTQKNREYIKSI